MSSRESTQLFWAPTLNLKCITSKKHIFGRNQHFFYLEMIENVFFIKIEKRKDKTCCRKKF